MRRQLKFLLTSIILIIIYAPILIFPEGSLHFLRVFSLFLSGIALLGLYISFGKKYFGRWVFFLPINLIHSYFLFFSAADGLMQNIMGRPFSFIDTVYLNDLYHLLVDSYGLITALFIIFIIVSIPILLIIINFVFHRELGKLWLNSKYKRYKLFLCTVTLLLFLFSISTSEKIWVPGIVEAKNMITLSSRKKIIAENLDEEAARRSETVLVLDKESFPLDKLKNQNVLVFIIESYGRTLFENPENWEIAKPRFKQFELDLKNKGFTIASSSLESPAIGGNSWLADSTFNSGVWVKDQTVYDELILSEIPVLGTYFKDAGYRTIVAQPGMRTSGDEEYFYNFDKTYNYLDFEYNGPSFIWAKMTDQYVVDFIDRKEVLTSEQPLFAQYILISSHFPFQLIPAYIEDWDRIGDGSIYSEENMVQTLTIPEGKKTAGPYGLTVSLLYVMEVLTEYITQLKEPGLIIILGDHQPYSKVTGPYGGRQTAIHVLSKDKSLIKPFIQRGYTPGLLSPPIDSAVKMDQFLPQFLEDFSSGSVF